MKREKNNISKCPICERPIHKESKYCIFHAGVEEKTEEKFKEALKEHVDKIKKENSDYDFEKFIFVGDISFKEDLNVTVFKNANFRKATFEGVASFAKVTFEGDANFRKATFVRVANFAKVTFKGNAIFNVTTFKDVALFFDANFKGDANFKAATFNFDVFFQVKSFEKSIEFHNIKASPGIVLLLVAGKNKQVISFNRANLEDAKLSIELGMGVLIDFEDAILKNTMIDKDEIENHILQEKEKEFNEAQKVYLMLKNNFHSIGKYDEESWSFIKEKEMEKKFNSFPSFLEEEVPFYINLLKKFVIFLIWLFSKKGIRWLNLSISSFIYQYGENPWYVIRFALIVILIFAWLLNVSGIVKSDRTVLILKQIEEMQGGNVLKYSGPIIGNFLDCLYFSVVTFTTLGYGDFQPLEGWSRFLVSSEALLGAFTMALFVYTFARRTGGR